MLDSEDVLLLRPVEGAELRPAAGPGGVLTAEVLLLRRLVDAGFLSEYAAAVEPGLEQAGSRRLALLETEPAPNTFPRLPVREGEFAVVRLARCRDEATPAAVRERLGRAGDRLAQHLAAAPQLLRLEPTPRSRLR
jgi:hypothetical protein